MRGGTDKTIEAGFRVASLITSFIQALFGLISRKYLGLEWSILLAIFQTIPIILIFGVKKGIINFVALLVIALVMALIGTRF